MHLSILLIGVLIGVVASLSVAQIPAADQILATLNKTHPRLIASSADFAKLRERYQSDPAFKPLADKLIASAVAMIDQPASTYEIPDGKRLLATSRRVLDRVETLAIAYHLTHEKRFVDRAWAELDAAGQFKDWNPSHFLDTAEMTNAFAIGYDWLFDQWTPGQRQQLREAIVKNGLRAGLEAYEIGAWWTKASHNWNQVCNGGLMMGALAIAEDEPAMARRIVYEAVKRYPAALKHYGPDGAWNEGPGYWGYATRYTARPLAGLKTALGTDFGLSDEPGLSKAGNFAMHIVSPMGEAFNFADGNSGWGGAPDLWWFADRYRTAELRSVQKPYAMAKPRALDLLWGDFSVPGAIPDNTPTDAYFRGSEVATFRTKWNDRNALFAGLKSGDNKANHSNLDLGSFVLDALGERFILDLGPDNYNLPGYFGKQRWTYYRLRAEGHNTLVIGPSEAADQDPEAVATITRFQTGKDAGFAITDLTPAYANSVRAARGLSLRSRNDRPTVVLQDEIETKQPADVWWFAHTKADIALADDARSATLTLKGKTLQVHLLEPADARFTIEPAAPLSTSLNPQGQNANKDTRKLAIYLSDVKQTRLVVTFGVEPVAADISPLAEW